MIKTILPKGKFFSQKLFIIALMLLVCMASVSATNYEIYDWKDLYDVRDDAMGHYDLMNDLDSNTAYY